MSNEPLFIYYLDEGYKTLALTLFESRDRGPELKAQGWRHTATIDPLTWLKAFIEADHGKGADMLQDLIGAQRP